MPTNEIIFTNVQSFPLICIHTQSGRDSFTLPAPGKELHCSIQVFPHYIFVHPILLHKLLWSFTWVWLLLIWYCHIFHYMIIFDQVDESTIILTGGTPEGMNAETGVFEYSGLGQSYEVLLINIGRIQAGIDIWFPRTLGWQWGNCRLLSIPDLLTLADNIQWIIPRCLVRCNWMIVLSLLVYAASVASTEFHMRNHITMNNTEVLLGVHLLIYNTLPMFVYAASITYTEFHVCHLKNDLYSFWFWMGMCEFSYQISDVFAFVPTVCKMVWRYCTTMWMSHMPGAYCCWRLWRHLPWQHWGDGLYHHK